MANTESSRNARLKATGKAIGKGLLSLSIHVARLLLEASRYLGRRLLDLGYIVRRLLLIRTRRRFPERASEAESRIAALREKRTVRWAPWCAVPLRRRLEVQTAVLAILLAFTFGVRAYITPPPAIPAPLPDSREGQAERAAQEYRLAKLKEYGEKLPRDFAKRRKDASPGQWIFFGGYAGLGIPGYRFAAPVLMRGESKLWDTSAFRDLSPDSIAWDDFKVTSPVVLKEGGRYRMWYVGCHFLVEEYTCGIGHATSSDGIAWEKSPQPLFSIEDPAQSKELDALAVARAGERYLMWYSIRGDWFNGNGHATLHLATSTDGLHWQQEGTVLTTMDENTFTIGHSALYDGKMFHLWYVDVPSPGGPTSIVHFTSSNGKEWQIAGSTSLKDAGADPGDRLWVLPDIHGGYRGVFADGGPFGGAERFGLLTSADGNTWQRADQKTFSENYDFGSYNTIDQPAVLAEPDGLMIWFVLQQRINSIGVAFRKEGNS